MLNAAHKPVLHWIEMHVIDVPLEIGLVADRVLPKAPLPKHKFTVALTRDRHTGGNKGVRETRLDALPATGEIGVALRQSPNRMQVVREYYDRVDGKRAFAARHA